MAAQSDRWLDATTQASTPRFDPCQQPHFFGDKPDANLSLTGAARALRLQQASLQQGPHVPPPIGNHQHVDLVPGHPVDDPVRLEENFQPARPATWRGEVRERAVRTRRQPPAPATWPLRFAGPQTFLPGANQAVAHGFHESRDTKHESRPFYRVLRPSCGEKGRPCTLDRTNRSVGR